MHGVVLAGGDGTPVRPAILWLDRRAGAEAAAYETLPPELTAPLGNQPSAGMAGPILCWLAGHEADAMRRARWALQPKDWLRLRLTGRAATDPTDASGTLLFDLPRNAWAGDLIGALGLPAEKLPGIREPAAIAGPLLAGPARELGLTAGIPVAIGAADTAAALHSAAADAVALHPLALEPAHGGERWALLTLGTGGQWIAPEGSFRPNRGVARGHGRPRGDGRRAAPHAGISAPHAGGHREVGPRGQTEPTENTNLFRAADGGFYRLAPAQNVGAALNWVRGVFGVSWQQLYDTAARPWRPDTPLFLPYLAQERWDRARTGTWTGLSLAHQRDDLLRGALEGVAFLLRRRLDDLRAAGHDPRDVIIGGGGTSHPAWRQLLADALGLPLRPAATTWLSATGAARLAAAAAGMGGAGGSPIRSGYEETEPVVPGQLNAAGAGYDRFTHKLAVPEIGVITG